MTIIEYLKQLDKTAPIPASLMTCGELLELLEEQTMTGEQADIMRWQNEPDFQDEPKEVQPKIDFTLIDPIEF